MLDKLSSHLFWDVNRSTLDAEKHKRFIITRVMERGDLADVKLVWSAYSPDEIREALTNARCLSPKTIAFFVNQFGIRHEDFRAYKKPAGTAKGYER